MKQHKLIYTHSTVFSVLLSVVGSIFSINFRHMKSNINNHQSKSCYTMNSWPILKLNGIFPFFNIYIRSITSELRHKMLLWNDQNVERFLGSGKYKFLMLKTTQKIAVSSSFLLTFVSLSLLSHNYKTKIDPISRVSTPRFKKLP